MLEPLDTILNNSLFLLQVVPSVRSCRQLRQTHARSPPPSDPPQGGLTTDPIRRFAIPLPHNIILLSHRRHHATPGSRSGLRRHRRHRNIWAAPLVLHLRRLNTYAENRCPRRLSPCAANRNLLMQGYRHSHIPPAQARPRRRIRTPCCPCLCTIRGTRVAFDPPMRAQKSSSRTF